MNALEQAQIEDTKRNMAKGRFSTTQIDKIFHDFGEDLQKRTEREITSFLLNVFAVALHDEHGFGQQRIERTISKVANELECYDKGLVKTEDFAAILDQDCGYKIQLEYVEG